MQIYYVGDAGDVRSTVTSLLTGLNGVEIVGAAASAALATDDILLLRPDVVVLSTQLEDSATIATLVKIKQELPAVVVMILAEPPPPHLRAQYICAGADFFFENTTEVLELIAVAEQLVAHFDAGSLV
ncbi:MAG: Chemotaxis response regulator protein-glutamate methylesterase [Verrucomicrobiae bacterium]|nr:Chemotaxis response regulator protein-glutamate methylesterase [Verrucomicrobiae bacterium]